MGSQFDDHDWEAESARHDEWETPDYTPSFDRDRLPQVAEFLSGKDWISFQRIRSNRRPVRDITALSFLPHLTGLALSDNEITDLTPLSQCRGLKQLHLGKNPIASLDPIANCTKLRFLSLPDSPGLSLTALESLINLDRLELPSNSVAGLRELANLPALKMLWFQCSDRGFDSFDGLPHMPVVREFAGAKVDSLDGLSQFPSLHQLSNLSGEFESLEPLKELKQLSHVNMYRVPVDDLSPLAWHPALCCLRLDTIHDDLDFEPLESIPTLRSVSISSWGEEFESSKRLQAKLPSWDEVFYSLKARGVPSTNISVVEQEEFDRYDGHEAYGTKDGDGNEAMLGSEREWIDERFEKVLSELLTEKEAFELPFQNFDARSRTIILYSRQVLPQLDEIIIGIQDVLCHAQNDWIIYLQSEWLDQDDQNPETDFIAWVYPDKIVTTAEHATTLESFLP